MKDGKYNILIVDDEVQVQNSLYFILGKEEDYELFSVKSAEEMFRFLEQLSDDDLPDIILLDIIMPGMDGFEAAELLKIQDRYKDIIIIFISGLSDEISELRGYTVGAKDYIYKPFHDSHLTRRLYIQKELIRIAKEYEDVKKNNVS